MPQLMRAPTAAQQIADYLRSQIRRGEYAPGAQLPTIDQLAAEWDAHRSTVYRAMMLLQREGLVTKPGYRYRLRVANVPDAPNLFSAA